MRLQRELEEAEEKVLAAQRAYRKKQRELRVRRANGAEIGYLDELSLLELGRDAREARGEFERARSRFELEEARERFYGD